MMNDYRIRLSSTDSVRAVNKTNFVDLDLKRSAKLFPFPAVSDTIDQYEVFKSERDKCTKYRLIVTINPLCSNILFNTITEVTRNEGSKEVETLDDKNQIKNDISDVYGKKKPNRIDAVENTEYSREKIGFDYKCGFDIFDNHILRNLTFKLINKGSGDDFNTLRDKMRTADGKIIQYKKRSDISSISGERDKHLYLNSDILDITNSVNANLTEENGWWGFINNSTIMPKYRKDEKSDVWEENDISRVINTKTNCEFIDMYPDRTLFSFNPKYNEHRHRAEYNWKECLTYPYKNDYGHPIVSNRQGGDGKTNGLKIMSIKRVKGLNDNTLLLVRTFTKHGLQKSDKVYLYYSDDDNTYTRSSNYYTIANVGNLNKEYNDYYFYLTDLSFIEDALGMEYWYGEDGGFLKDETATNNAFSNKQFRLRRVYNGKESEYYLRIFRKLPNFKFRKVKPEEHDMHEYRYLWSSDDKEIYKDLNGKTGRDVMQASADTYNFDNDYDMDVPTIDKYIGDNATNEEGKLIDFDKEQYRLAFATNIYSDASTQITFTDTIDIDKLVDNWGRPLTKIYFTIIKNNKGYKEWYETKHEDGLIKDEDGVIEFSHCFGKITSGIKFHTEANDSEGSNLYDRAKMSDVGIINNLNCYYPQSIEDLVDFDGGYKGDNGELISNDYFIGDIAEFIPCNAEERILDSCYYRFNTAQRELLEEDNLTKSFIWHEIASDDYDLDDYKVETYGDDESEITKVNIGGTNCYPRMRPEGYYYKPHYELSLREFGEVQQSSHYNIRVIKATPVQMGDIYIKLTTAIRSYVSAGDTILICDDNNNIEWRTEVIEVVDSTNFIVNRLKDSVINWIKLCDILNSPNENMKFKVRRVNKDIPSYATKVGANKYLWRNVLNVGDDNAVNLPEYPYANDHFYMNLNINFFLRRQDPDGLNGLYAKQHFPNDVFGNIKVPSNYLYKDEKEIIC